MLYFSRIRRFLKRIPLRDFLLGGSCKYSSPESMEESPFLEELLEEVVDEVELSELLEVSELEPSELEPSELEDDDDDSFEVSGPESGSGVAGKSSGIEIRFCACDASHNVLSIARTSMLCDPPGPGISFNRNDDFEPAINWF